MSLQRVAKVDDLTLPLRHSPILSSPTDSQPLRSTQFMPSVPACWRIVAVVESWCWLPQMAPTTLALTFWLLSSRKSEPRPLVAEKFVVSTIRFVSLAFTRRTRLPSPAVQDEPLHGAIS